MITYLSYIKDFLTELFSYNVVNGITLGTICVYNILLITLFTVFVRRS